MITDEQREATQRHVDAVVAAAPDLTADQMDRLRTILHPASGSPSPAPRESLSCERRGPADA